MIIKFHNYFYPFNKNVEYNIKVFLVNKLEGISEFSLIIKLIIFASTYVDVEVYYSFCQYRFQIYKIRNFQ